MTTPPPESENLFKFCECEDRFKPVIFGLRSKNKILVEAMEKINQPCGCQNPNCPCLIAQAALRESRGEK